MEVEQTLSIDGVVVSEIRELGNIKIYQARKSEHEATYYYTQNNTVLFVQHIFMDEGVYGEYFDGCRWEVK